MKKILIPILLGLLCSPVNAEMALHDFVRELGYTEAFIQEGVPEVIGKKADIATTRSMPDQRPTSATVHVSPKAELSDPADLLHPRVFQKGESPAMIPMLMRLQKSNPASAKITRKLAVTCLRNGQPREALYWYVQTYQRDRSDFESLWNMASIAYRLGEMDQAKKYLKEYAALDSNSAWGRMAREFLAGSFSGSTLNDGFKGGFGRTMQGPGKSTRQNDSGDQVTTGTSEHGVMVIEGERTTFAEYMGKKEEVVKAKSHKKSGTLEGKPRVKASSGNEESKSSLQKAKIVENSVMASGSAELPVSVTPAVTTPAVTATAPPAIP